MYYNNASSIIKTATQFQYHYNVYITRTHKFDQSTKHEIALLLGIFSHGVFVSELYAYI